MNNMIVNNRRIMLYIIPSFRPLYFIPIKKQLVWCVWYDHMSSVSIIICVTHTFRAMTLEHNTALEFTSTQPSKRNRQMNLRRHVRRPWNGKSSLKFSQQRNSTKQRSITNNILQKEAALVPNSQQRRAVMIQSAATANSLILTERQPESNK